MKNKYASSHVKDVTPDIKPLPTPITVSKSKKNTRAHSIDQKNSKNLHSYRDKKNSTTHNKHEKPNTQLNSDITLYPIRKKLFTVGPNKHLS
ncbi:hypothetical protein Hanom_Chr06g00555131 [Helianthus anomalus]